MERSDRGNSLLGILTHLGCITWYSWKKILQENVSEKPTGWLKLNNFKGILQDFGNEALYPLPQSQINLWIPLFLSPCSV
jgi:hypothetical protein